jgi:SulP family sulfate permease
VASPLSNNAPSSLLERLLPAAGWLKRYSRRDLSGDISAGLVVAVMLIPQGMAYALLAGLPPVVGLYASTIPLFIYALFGSSRHLAVGPVAIVSLLTLTAVSQLAAPGSSEFVALAALLALLVGAIQLALGLLRAGFVTTFLSHAVISGFTSAAAIVIGLSQLRHLLGIELPSSHNALLTLWHALGQLGGVHAPTLAIGAGSMAALIVARRYLPRFPAALAVVLVSTLAVYALGLHERGVRIVGDIPRGLPSFSVPALTWEVVVALLPMALTIAFIGFMESIAMAKAIAAKERYPIDANRELVGLGLANLAGGVFSSYPVTGGFSRSAVNYQAGARTPLASIVTAILIVLTLVFFTPLFYYLPQAVLAAIVIVAVAGLVDVREAKHLLRLKAVDGWTLVLTFVATLILGIEQGILLGVVFSLLVFIWRSAYPHTAELGYVPRLGVFRNLRRFSDAQPLAETLILRVDASLYFANMAFLTAKLSEIVPARPIKYLILDFSGVNDIDTMALDTLEATIAALKAQGISVHIAAMKGPVRDLTTKAGWPHKYGHAIEHLSVEHAARALGLMPDASEKPTAARVQA